MHHKSEKLFFSGIGGSGMSAIANLMADKGRTVTGSDRAFDLNPQHPLKKTLVSKGISIVPQDGSGLDETFNLAVFSSAVEQDRPEVLKARTLKIPVKLRSEYLADITKSFRTLAVAGTSGKSTASGMLAFIMRELNLSPSFIGGGRVRQFRTPSNSGNALSGNSDYLIIEACESDGSVVHYRPEHSILLNLSFDHNPVSETAEMFRSFMRNTAGKMIVNADDENLGSILPDDAVTFSIRNPSDYMAEDIEYNSFSTDFTVRKTEFRLSLPGTYNLYNSLACIALLSEMGISLHATASVLPRFNGVERRFDIHLNDERGLVIDDYAHNPHKIASLMETVRRLRERICYIFQPHGFGPTRMMKKGYIDTFKAFLRDSDHLCILPIFYSGGTASKDISSHDLAEVLKTAGHSVEAVDKREDVFNVLDGFDACVVFGARDDSLSDFAKRIAEKFTEHKSRIRNVSG